MTHPFPEALLTLQRDSATRMGSDRIRLLRAIETEGSISAAARAIGLSYKAAWDGVNSMNNLFSQALVSSQSGGKRGGGATLTPAGRQVLAAFIQLETELGQFMLKLQQQLEATDTTLTPNLLWSMMMKTSSRNMFLCSVRQITESTVNAEVTLSLTDGQQLVAVITRQSAADLGLEAGSQCYALIKSSFVIVCRDDEGIRTSARNRLCGTVISLENGEINSEICLDLGDGKTLVATVTRDSALTLDLKPGDMACALVKASHVILAVQ